MSSVFFDTDVIIPCKNSKTILLEQVAFPSTKKSNVRLNDVDKEQCAFISIYCIKDFVILFKLRNSINDNCQQFHKLKEREGLEDFRSLPFMITTEP